MDADLIKAASVEWPEGSKTRVTIYIPEEAHKAIKMEAAQRGMSMSDVIMEALQSRVIVLRHPEDEKK